MEDVEANALLGRYVAVNLDVGKLPFGHPSVGVSLAKDVVSLGSSQLSLFFSTCHHGFRGCIEAVNDPDVFEHLDGLSSFELGGVLAFHIAFLAGCGARKGTVFCQH